MMQKLIRTTLFVAAALVLGVSTAPAQTYNLVADSTDLAIDGDPADVQCIAPVPSGFVLFNSNAGGIYVWQENSLSAHTDSTTLNSNITTTSNPINRCDAVERDESGNVYFSFRASDDQTQPNYIYKTSLSDATDNTFKELDGTLGLAVYNSTLYLASYAFFDDTGSREDGIYSISTDLSGSPSEVATDPDLSIDGGIDVSGSGVLYSYSNSFAGGDFGQKVVSLDLTSNSPSFQVFSDPYSSGSPLNSGEENIEDVDVTTFDGDEYIVVHNQNPGAPSGEEFGAIKVSDGSISVLFTASDLASNLSVSEYGGAFARSLTVTGANSVNVASGGGSRPYIATVSSPPPLPVEMASFDAVQSGSSVELTWQTVSETNNAGFRVQRQTETGWTSLDFVESKATGGTTTEAQSYRYTIDGELEPGTHQFRLQQKDLDGTTSFTDVVSVDVGLNEALRLSAPAPNPVSGQATVSFAVKEQTETTVSVYNVLGQQVSTLYRGKPSPDQAKDLTFDTSGLSSGVYFVRLQANGQTRTQRLTVVK
jgi:hypothetical protein